MIDIKSFKASLKMKWVQSYLNTAREQRQMESIFRLLLGEMRREISVLV